MYNYIAVCLPMVPNPTMLPSEGSTMLKRTSWFSFININYTLKTNVKSKQMCLSVDFLENLRKKAILPIKIIVSKTIIKGIKVHQMSSWLRSFVKYASGWATPMLSVISSTICKTCAYSNLTPILPLKNPRPLFLFKQCSCAQNSTNKKPNDCGAFQGPWKVSGTQAFPGGSLLSILWEFIY